MSTTTKATIGYCTILLSFIATVALAIHHEPTNRGLVYATSAILGLAAGSALAWIEHQVGTKKSTPPKNG